jgi:hypothetical protein
MLQIVFNTRQFIEEKSKSNEYDLAKKLQELILTNITKPSKKVGQINDEQYDIIISYYFKSAKLNVQEYKYEEEKCSSKPTHYLENSIFYLHFYKYLYQLLLKVLFHLFNSLFFSF